MIRLGQAGIPLSCKGRTIRDGIEDTFKLGLTAMEIQLIREVDKKTRDEIDTISVMADSMIVTISIHTPYYIDLVTEGEVMERSIQSIIKTGMEGEKLGARYLITHLGPYGEYTPREALSNAIKCVRKIRDTLRKKGLKIRLAVETSGKAEALGSLDDVLPICRRVNGVWPIINFGHIHSRTNGGLQTREDFQEIFDRVDNTINLYSYYMHFSGVAYENGDEKHFIPIKKADYKFDPLAEVILENELEVTIISDSPLLEHDAMYMKVILERVLQRKEAKKAKEMQRQRELEASRKRNANAQKQ